MHTSNPSSNRIARVLAVLASIVVALGLLAASSSAAYAATGNQKLDEKRLASQSSDSEGSFSSDRASTEFGLIGKGGYLYPADAQGNKVADTWADRTFNTKAITKLFVASDATSIPGPLFVPKTEKSGSMQDIMTFTNLGDVTFLLDDNGRNACKSIGASAFAYSSVSTLTNFEKTRVEVIDKQAFSNSQLISISLPPTLKRIGPGAFSASRWLESLSGLGKTKLTSIGNGAFESCTSLNSVTLPDSCTTIGSAAFRFPSGEVPSLKSVVGGRKLKAIQSEAFSGCSTLESVKLRGSGVKVGSRAFASCSALRAFPFSKVASIGEGAFQYDVSLKGSLVISRDCESIGCAAFADCALLRKVILPSTLKKIDNGTFAGCAHLTSVTLPNACESIGVSAFSRCTNLRAITAGKSLKRIGNNAFAYCSKLSKITMKGKGPVVKLRNSSLYATKFASGKGVLYVPGKQVAKYRKSEWARFGNPIKALRLS